MALTDLFENLDNLLKLHQALYTLAVEKKAVLIKGDIHQLTDITHTEQKLIKAVQATETQRIALVQQLYRENGISLSDGTLEELIKIWRGLEEKNRLKHYREELIRIVTELRRANELNQQLLEQSLSFVNLSLELITDTPEDDFIYQHPSNYGPTMQTTRSFFNKKA